MIRPEYWERSKELIKWCNEEELNVLQQQAVKALNNRIDAYTGKIEASDKHRKKVGQRKAKEAAIKSKSLS